MIMTALARPREAAGMLVEVGGNGDTLHNTSKESCRARFMDEMT